MNTSSDYSIADMYLDKRDFYGDFVNLKICRRNLSNALVEIEYECMYVCIHINMHTCMHARMWLVYLCLYVEEEEEKNHAPTVTVLAALHVKAERSTIVATAPRLLFNSSRSTAATPLTIQTERALNPA